MHVTVAKNAGFCFGVKRALQYAEKAVTCFGEIYSLGPLIHNPQEVERLSKKGIKWVNDLDQVKGKHVIIRSHGVKPEIFYAAAKKDISVIDATCPFVKRAQLYAKDLAENGYLVVVVGDRNHPEVEGIMGWTNNTAVVIESAEEAAVIALDEKVGIIAQTTQTENNFQKVVDVLKKRIKNLIVYNTICLATTERQKTTATLAQNVDLMLVIGGSNSANTKKLARISREVGTPTYHVETASQIDVSWLKGVKSVGITAGASTPDWIIEEVLQKMMEINEHDEKKLVDESTEQDTKVQEINQEGTEVTPANQESSFAEAYDRGIKEVRRGERISGTVVQVRDTEVLVDVGSKSEGVIPKSELSSEEAENIHDAIKVGDQIEVLVLKRENEEGHPVLSKRRVDQEKVWEALANNLKTGEVITGKVIEVVKGGLLVDVGVRGFIPASLVDLGYVEDLKPYVGQGLRLRVIECDRSNNKLVLSSKSVLEEELQKRKEETWEKIREGSTVKGIVRRLTNFGAFVDIGGVDGLLHVSEMAWYRVNHPSDVMKEGDTLEVYVLAVDKDHEKVSLGLKQLLPNPWSYAEEKYPVGTIIEAHVVRTAPFGAFVQVEPGVEGLVHISQLAQQRVGKTEDVVSPGDVVKVKILGIDAAAKRMSLSIKEATGVSDEANKDNLECLEKVDNNGLEVSIGDIIGKPSNE